MARWFRKKSALLTLGLAGAAVFALGGCHYGQYGYHYDYHQHGGHHGQYGHGGTVGYSVGYTVSHTSYRHRPQYCPPVHYSTHGYYSRGHHGSRGYHRVHRGHGYGGPYCD